MTFASRKTDYSGFATGSILGGVSILTRYGRPCSEMQYF